MTTNFEHNGEDELQAGRLTAYALGQTEGAELAEIEAQLAASPQLREQVDQIRAMAGKVKEAMLGNGTASPSPSLREVLDRRLAAMEPASKPTTLATEGAMKPGWLLRALVVTAACICVFAIPAYYLHVGRLGMRGPLAANLANERAAASIRMGTQDNQVSLLPPSQIPLAHFSNPLPEKPGPMAPGSRVLLPMHDAKSDTENAGAANVKISETSAYYNSHTATNARNGEKDYSLDMWSLVPSTVDPKFGFDGESPFSGQGAVTGRSVSGAKVPNQVYSFYAGLGIDNELDELHGSTSTTPAKSRDEIIASANDLFSTPPSKPAPKPAEPWQPAHVVANSSRLMVGDKDELPLKGMQVDVRVDGFRARVVLDLYYFNDRAKQLEGNFQLRLPDEASPYFVAFGKTVYQAPQLAQASLTSTDSMFFKREQVSLGDTTPDKILELRSHSWEQPKVARMVPKEKAAFAYRDNVRRKVDPALVEWSGAGVFQCRVFPLAANSLHRIVIGYDVDLLPVGDDLELRLDLPGHAPACVVDLNVSAKAANEVNLDAPATPLADGQRLSYRLVDPKQRPLTVRLHKPGTAMLTGGDDASGGGEPGKYFATRFAPAVPEVPASEGSRNAIFMVDTSASAGPQFPLWTKMLRATLENNRDRIDRFAVLFFNVETFWWQEKYVDNTPENVEALMRYTNGLALEGATDLARALDEATTQQSWKKKIDEAKFIGDQGAAADMFLLSDGASTWGEDRWPLLSRSLGHNPLYAYRTGMAGTDLQMLSLLAEKTGGAVFTVLGDAEVNQASMAYRARPWKITGVEVQGGRDVLLAGRPRYLFPGQQLLAVGRLDRDAGDDGQKDKHMGQKFVTLSLQQGKATQTLKMAIDRTIDSEMAARTYGQVATGQLEDLNGSDETLATAYARHFRITGRTCSLLMLESDQDYARYNIKPEEDSFVVKERPAATMVAKAHDKAESPGDAKTLFMNWFHRLNEGDPGNGSIHFDIPTSLGIALDNLPAESFDIVGPALHCKLRQRDALPTQFQQPWATGLADYESLASEGDRRISAGNIDDAVRAISTLVEEHPGDVAVARDVAFSTIAWGRPGEAYHLLRRAASARTFEPVTFHALAHCMEQLGNSDMAIVYYELLCAGLWDARFGDVHNIAQLDYLRFLRKIADKPNGRLANYAELRRATLGALQLRDTAELAAMILWNTDGTDVDLHVIEPNGEECFYKNPQTSSGGHISRDVTSGYGPELYLLPQAPSGAYKLSAHYYAADANRTSTRTRVLALVYQGWGTKDEKVTVKAVALLGNSESHDLGTVKK